MEQKYRPPRSWYGASCCCARSASCPYSCSCSRTWNSRVRCQTLPQAHSQGTRLWYPEHAVDVVHTADVQLTQQLADFGPPPVLFRCTLPFGHNITSFCTRYFTPEGGFTNLRKDSFYSLKDFAKQLAVHSRKYNNLPMGWSLGWKSSKEVMDCSLGLM